MLIHMIGGQESGLQVSPIRWAHKGQVFWMLTLELRNVIFSGLDDNLVGRSVDHPRCCRRWSVGHLRCCEDGGNLRFSRQATEVLAWLRERTFTGEKLLGRARCLVPLFYGRTPLSGRLSCKNFTPSTAVEWRRAEKDRTGNYGWSWYFCTRFMKPAFTRI